MSSRAESRRPARRKAHRVARPEPLEPRLALAAAPVNPNTGSIVASQFQPYGYSLLGTQFTEVTAGGGASLQLTAPNNSGSPPAPPTDYGYPSAAVNTGLISGSRVNVGGFTTLGLQLQDTTLSGALRVDLLDEGIGKPAAGGTQPVPVGGANTLPLMVPPGSPGVVTNSGVIISSQFNDGGFGPLGIQASGLNVGGGLSIVSRNTIGSPDVPVVPAAIPFASPAQAMPVNAGTIRDSQLADGGFGDTGLQLRGVTVGGSLDVRAERLLIQPTTSPANVGPPTLVGRLNANTRVVMLTRPPGTSAPATSMLFPGMLVTGGGIPANTVIASIIGPATITLSKLPRQTTTSRLTFFTPSTNTGSIVSSQVADGGFGDIGLQWSNVTVGGRVATLHSGLEIQPEVDYVSSITTGPRQFGQPITPASTAPPAGPAPAIPLTGATPTAGAGAPAVGGTSATNSGTIVASQFADGGFGDIGMQWQNVHVTGSVEATHNALSIQPENNGQGQISVAAVSFATSPPPVAPAVVGPGGLLPSAPLITTPGTPVTPPLPAPTNPGGTGSVTNSATNSGLVSASQFADGGFGDVGLQWSNVTVRGDVQVVHNSLSIQPTGSALAGVSVQNVTFGSGTAPAGDPRLRPVTLQTLTVNSSGAAGTPPFVPDSMFARTANTADLNGRQFLSGPAGATSLQWQRQSLTRDASGFVIVNNVLKVSNTGTAGTAAGAQAGPITLNRITFPGSLPPTGLASRPVAAAAPARPGVRTGATVVRGIMLPAGRVGASAAAAARQASVNAASNSGRLQSNQFLDGGTGDIGLQWRGVTVNGSVRIEHNTLAVNVVSDATGTGPVLVSGIRFDSGWAAFGAASDILRLTPVVAATAPAARPAATAASAVNSSNGASNSGVLTRGQFLDGGMGQIGLQWQQVTINYPIRIVNNVLSVTVSGTNTRGVVVQDVTFV